MPNSTEAKPSVDPFEVRDRRVADQVLLRELQQLRLAQPEQHVERDHDDCVVRHDEGALADGGLEVAEEGAQPERDIRLRLAAGRAVVELAEVPAPREFAG